MTAQTETAASPSPEIVDFDTAVARVSAAGWNRTALHWLRRNRRALGIEDCFVQRVKFGITRVDMRKLNEVLAHRRTLPHQRTRRVLGPA